MKRFGAQFHKKAENIRLSTAERADLRARVVSYMEYHPLPKQAKSNIPTLVTTEPYRVVRINYAYFGSFIGAFTMLLLIVIPVVAEKAVPGDTLYPVKVQFNEEIRSTLSFSPYAKVEWETERLERRLAEARLLADEGRLTEEIEAAVALAVQTHSDAAKHEIEEIRIIDNDDATIAQITFASALEVQSEVLQSRGSRSEESGRSVAGLAGIIAEARNGVEVRESTNISYEKLLARLEEETTYAQEWFTSIQASASEQDIKNIKRRLEDIKRKIDTSVILYESVTAAATSTATTTDDEFVKNEKEAKTLLKVALIDTRKLISFMTDIDVRTNVSIEELVPMTLTSEETGALLWQRLEALNTQSQLIEKIDPNEEVTEKFEFGEEKFRKTLRAAEIAFKDSDYEETGALLTEAELMAADLMKMGIMVEKSVETESASTTESVEADLPVRATSSATSTDSTDEANDDSV